MHKNHTEVELTVFIMHLDTWYIRWLANANLFVCIGKDINHHRNK